jgi:hypothetical protein
VAESKKSVAEMQSADENEPSKCFRNVNIADKFDNDVM